MMDGIDVTDITTNCFLCMQNKKNTWEISCSKLGCFDVCNDCTELSEHEFIESLKSALTMYFIHSGKKFDIAF